MAYRTVTVQGIQFGVEFDYSPACEGSRDSMGVPEEPGTPEELELTSVKCGSQDLKDLLETNAVDLLDIIWGSTLESIKEGREPSE